MGTITTTDGRTAMERGILMCGAMALAVHDGHKTETRRVATLNHAGRVALGGKNWHVDDPNAVLACPYGQVGDRLWVRETWRTLSFLDPYPQDEWEAQSMAHRVDCAVVQCRSLLPRATEVEQRLAWGKWRPAIHMPRWASCCTVEIVERRLERVQAIRDADALAEGIAKLSKDGGVTWKYGLADADGMPGEDDFGWHWARWQATPVAAFRSLWDSINGKRAGRDWQANALVWVVTFKAVAR